MDKLLDATEKWLYYLKLVNCWKYQQSIDSCLDLEYANQSFISIAPIGISCFFSSVVHPFSDSLVCRNRLHLQYEKKSPQMTVSPTLYRSATGNRKLNFFAGFIESRKEKNTDMYKTHLGRERIINLLAAKHIEGQFPVPICSIEYIAVSQSERFCFHLACVTNCSWIPIR